MNVFIQLREFIKNIFSKKENIELLEEPKQEETKKSDERKQIEFIKSIKGIPQNQRKIETLVCPGNGLGINDKISY